MARNFLIDATDGEEDDYEDSEKESGDEETPKETKKRKIKDVDSDGIEPAPKAKKPRKKQESKVMQLMLTWSQNNIGAAAVIKALSEAPEELRKPIIWAIAREEHHGISDEDGVHTHMLIRFMYALRWTEEMRKEFNKWGGDKGVNIMPPRTGRATAKSGVKYILKHWIAIKNNEGDDEKGESHVIWGSCGETTRDLERIITNLKGVGVGDKIVARIREGCTNDDLDNEFGSWMLTHAQGTLNFKSREEARKIQKAGPKDWPILHDLLGNIIPEPKESNRKRHLAFFGNPGCGKSHWIAHELGENAYHIQDKRKAELEFAFEGYNGQRIIVYDDCPGLSETEFKSAAEGKRELPGKQRMGKTTPVPTFERTGPRLVIIVGNSDQRPKWMDSDRVTTRLVEQRTPDNFQWFCIKCEE